MDGNPDGGTLLGPEEIGHLESLMSGATVDFAAVLEYIGHFISEGISKGRFTERRAHHDLEIALWVAYACNNMDDYEHYYTATEWLARVEDLACDCGTWYYRYANALMYCGRPNLALEYCERGVVADPDYPWTWLTLGRLRAHFGDRNGAIAAADRGLELLPGDHEFTTLLYDIGVGATIEQMEMHYIDPDSDAALQEGDDPSYEAKKLAISGIVCDRQALSEIRIRLGATGWSADHPYCTYLMDRADGPVMVTFMMNEAALSKKDPEALEEIVEQLDRMDAEARTQLEDRTGNTGLVLFGLSITPYLEVKLSYSLPGTEDVHTVDFDSDLDLLDAPEGGPFAAILLMSDDSCGPEDALAAMRDRWDLNIPDAELSDDSAIGTLWGCVAAVSIIRSPVPGGEARENAANNYLWPEAVEAADRHRAHMIVALVNHYGDPLECGILFTKMVAACATLPSVTGIYNCGTVFEPSAFIRSAECMRDGDIPVEDMVWFGMYRTPEGINAYTMGMTVYGRDEMEVIGAGDPPKMVAAFLYDVAYHVLSTGEVFKDGDTLGFEEGQSLKVTRSPGVSVDGFTLKIEYPDSNDD